MPQQARGLAQQQGPPGGVAAAGGAAGATAFPRAQPAPAQGQGQPAQAGLPHNLQQRPWQQVQAAAQHHQQHQPPQRHAPAAHPAAPAAPAAPVPLPLFDTDWDYEDLPPEELDPEEGVDPAALDAFHYGPAPGQGPGAGAGPPPRQQAWQPPQQQARRQQAAGAAGAHAIDLTGCDDDGEEQLPGAWRDGGEQGQRQRQGQGQGGQGGEEDEEVDGFWDSAGDPLDAASQPHLQQLLQRSPGPGAAAAAAPASAGRAAMPPPLAAGPSPAPGPSLAASAAAAHQHQQVGAAVSGQPAACSACWPGRTAAAAAGPWQELCAR
jgi:hypothetical protein